MERYVRSVVRVHDEFLRIVEMDFTIYYKTFINILMHFRKKSYSWYEVNI